MSYYTIATLNGSIKTHAYISHEEALSELLYHGESEICLLLQGFIYTGYYSYAGKIKTIPAFVRANDLRFA